MVRLFYLSLLIPIQVFCKNVPDSLQTLDLQHKNLTKLPDDFSYINVQSLLLGHNSIKTLPTALATAKNLRTLSLNYNPQLDFEESIHTLKLLKLESLAINNSNLMYLPLEIGEIKSLTNLSLANNYIKEIPEYIFVHTDLYSLNLSGNLIQKLPEEIRSQQNLSIVDLSKNPCISLTDTYKRLSYLSNLTDLSVKGASTLPASLWDIKTLQRIDISDGTFQNLELSKEASKHSITQFVAENCDNLDFSTLIPLLFSPSIKTIALGGGMFNGFSNASVSSNVINMTLSGTQLNHFSFSSTPTNLEELHLNFGSITCYTEFSTTLSKLTKLKTLDLSNCNFSVLPEQIRNLNQLEHLKLSGNTLNSITQLLPLKQLATLDVSLCGLSNEQIEKLKKELPNTTIICYQPYSGLPLENAKVATEKFAIDPANPKTIVTQNGTTITIPKNSLVYNNGKPVKEPVTISYTPYYSLADIAVSGINMNYKTVDTDAPFSSAGMFKLLANVDNQNVELKKGADITVAFKSNDAEQSYNYYLYDTIKRSWAQTGKDTITRLKIAKLQNDTSSNNFNSFATLPAIQMPQPVGFYRYNPILIQWDLINHKKISDEFTLNTSMLSSKNMNDTTVLLNYFNELKPLMSNLKWKMDINNTPLLFSKYIKKNKLMSSQLEERSFKRKPRYYITSTQITKSVEFDLIADKEHDNFIFRFYDDVDTVSFNAYPIIENRNTERAQKSIKKMFFKYKSMAESRRKITEYKRLRFKRAYEAYKIEMAKARELMREQNKKEIDLLLNEKVNTAGYNITRVLSLQGFGVYNCDRPVVIENPIVICPVFYNEKGSKLENVSFQVIDPKENIVVSYYKPQGVRVSKNSVITFVNNAYGINNTSGSSVSIGKLNTFDSGLRSGGKAEITLTAVPNDVTVGQLSDMINSIP